MKTFDSRWIDKEILVAGIPIEEFPMKQAAMHYDDAIVMALARAVVIQAIHDWKRLNKNGPEAFVKDTKTSCNIYRGDVTGFFNGSFFGSILAVLAPNVSQEHAVRTMTKAKIPPGALGLGRSASVAEANKTRIIGERRSRKK